MSGGPGGEGGRELYEAWARVASGAGPVCGKAGRRTGSLCAIEVEGLKRHPPMEVGGLSLEFRMGLGLRCSVQGLGCRV